jgi:hypothetical protein
VIEGVDEYGAVLFRIFTGRDQGVVDGFADQVYVRPISLGGTLRLAIRL